MKKPTMKQARKPFKEQMKNTGTFSNKKPPIAANQTHSKTSKRHK